MEEGARGEGESSLTLAWHQAKDNHLKLRVLHILFTDNQQMYTHMCAWSVRTDLLLLCVKLVYFISIETFSVLQQVDRTHTRVNDDIKWHHRVLHHQLPNHSQPQVHYIISWYLLRIHDYTSSHTGSTSWSLSVVFLLLSLVVSMRRWRFDLWHGNRLQCL